MKKVTVYSTTTCPYCVQLNHWLNDKKIAFTEYKVDINPVAAQSMMLQSGQRGVPFTVIEEEGLPTQKILGFDLANLNKIFNVA